MDKKVKKTIEELKEWLEKPDTKDFYHLNPVNEIKTMLQEDTIRKSILNRFEIQNIWYSDNFVYDMLTKEISSFGSELAANGYYTIILADKFADKYPNNPPNISLDEIAYRLANCLIQKWYSESEEIINIINKGLETKFLEKGQSIKTTAWFIINLANKCYNKTIDYTKYNYPKNMGVYQNALDNWNTNDLNIIDTIITKLSDFHLKEASYGDLSDKAGKKDPMFLQFSKTSWFVYAFEIITWLIIREKIGLKNPSLFTHSLMNIPLNKIPTKTLKLPEDKYFKNITKKI